MKRMERQRTSFAARSRQHAAVEDEGEEGGECAEGDEDGRSEGLTGECIIQISKSIDNGAQ